MVRSVERDSTSTQEKAKRGVWWAVKVTVLPFCKADVAGMVAYWSPLIRLGDTVAGRLVMRGTGCHTDGYKRVQGIGTPLSLKKRK